MADHRQGQRQRHRSQLAAAVLAIALAVTGCSSISSLAARQGPGGTASSSKGSDVPALGNDLGLNNAAAPGSAVPPKDPFAGTPADDWPDGAAGIVTPKPGPIGGYTKAQVEYAYQTTKKLLVAAYLNKQTLLGGPPTAFEDLLTSQQRTQFVKNLNKKGLDKRGAPLSSRDMVMSFPPGDAQLIGSVIKVHGTMSAKTSTDQGQKELDVHLDYLFTYPVEPPGHPAQWMRIVSETVWTVAFGYWQGSSSTLAPWVTVDGGGVAGAQCDTTDGYQHPDYPVPVTAPNSSDSPSGKPINPYAMNGAETDRSGCQATTGT